MVSAARSDAANVGVRPPPATEAKPVATLAPIGEPGRALSVETIVAALAVSADVRVAETLPLAPESRPRHEANSTGETATTRTTRQTRCFSTQDLPI